MRPIAAPLTRKTAFRAALCGATAALAVAAGSAAGAAQGEQGPSPARPARDFSTYQPTAKATRIEANEAPTVDGDLSDPIWQKAAPITEFYQVEPVEGADTPMSASCTTRTISTFTSTPMTNARSWSAAQA